MASHAPIAKKTTAQAKGSTFQGRALDVNVNDQTPREEARTYHSHANVVAAAVLRVNDQPRFQQFHNLFKNKNKELTTQVLRMFQTGQKKENARRWMAANVGNPPDATSGRLTLLELGQIALVSLALTKYGAATLHDLFDRGRLASFVDIPLLSDELRSANQNAYRAHSTSTQKERKDVAHYVGLDFIVKLNRDLPEQHRVASAVLRELLNSFANFRMVKLETNRGFHKEVDALLLRAYAGDTVRLTAAQRQRVVHIVAFCQSETFQTTMLENRGVYLYAKIRSVVNKLDRDRVPSPAAQPTLWDEERDKRGLQSTAASASLRVDSTPDRRFRENKILSDRELGARVTAQMPLRFSAKQPTSARAVTSTPPVPVKTRALTPPSPPPAPVRPTPTAPARQPSAGADRTRTPSTAPPPATSQPKARPKQTATATARPVAMFKGHEVFEGPRGGRYYVDGNGKKVYVTGKT